MTATPAMWFAPAAARFQSKGAVIKATGEHHYDKGVCTVCGAKDPNYKPPTTGDSGVLLYVGLAVMAIGGSAAVVTRQKRAHLSVNLIHPHKSFRRAPGADAPGALLLCVRAAQPSCV